MRERNLRKLKHSSFFSYKSAIRFLLFGWFALLISSVSAIGVSSTLADVSALRPDTLALINKFRATRSPPILRRQLVEADIPAIGCPLDGQAGPQDTPTLPKTMRVVVPEGMASALAYYSAFEGMGAGVLAPKGWDCFGTYGSAGSTLYVLPRKLGDPIIDRPKKVKDGPAVISNGFTSDTSGRVPVAQISARIFPLARTFVERVRDQGKDDLKDYVFSPWATDRLNYLSDFAVSYVTPPGADGLGTTFGPAPGKEAISGLVFLNNIGNGYAPALERLAVRLEKANQRLYPGIAVSKIAWRDLPHPSTTPFSADGSNAHEVEQKIYNSCQEQWRISETVAICLLESENEYGTELSEIYQVALKLPARNSEELRRSQRSWLNYQEANCKFHEGAAQKVAGLPRVASARCLLLTTLQRLQELRQITE
jgi:uncharacterized protein YecT (DUF1311 family)